MLTESYGNFGLGSRSGAAAVARSSSKAPWITLAASAGIGLDGSPAG
jgi:hypothetical protein